MTATVVPPSSGISEGDKGGEDDRDMVDDMMRFATKLDLEDNGGRTKKVVLTTWSAVFDHLECRF